MPKKFDAVEWLSETLELYSIMTPKSRRRRTERLGRRLGEIIYRDRGPFTPAYLNNVVAGRMEAGEPLRRAIKAYALNRSEDRCPIAGAFSPVMVRSRGNVESGALILAGSKRCKWRRCSTPFVGRSGNQDYCSKPCRRRDYRERRRTA